MTVYLDMDGVLADFFGKVQEVYHVEHWKELNMDVVIAKIQNTNFFLYNQRLIPGFFNIFLGLFSCFSFYLDVLGII